MKWFYEKLSTKKTSPQRLKFISKTKANKKTKSSCNLFVTHFSSQGSFQHVTVTISQCTFKQFWILLLKF